MSDALPLPRPPNLEQYKKLASEFQSACKSSEPGAIRDWAAGWLEAVLPITPEVQSQIDGEVARIERRWHKFKSTNERAARCTLADAQFFVAREHGFASWSKFARHVEALARADSPVARFEAAVDAIVNGDAAAIEKLLRENPKLVRARSTREHRSTLLHYVAANGVEDFRQKTPKNIIEIARLLLQGRKPRRERPFDIVAADGADAAVRLRPDVRRFERCQQRVVDLIDRGCVAQCLTHQTVDVGAGAAGGEPRSRAGRELGDGFWKVAFVGAADLILRPSEWRISVALAMRETIRMSGRPRPPAILA